MDYRVLENKRNITNARSGEDIKDLLTLTFIMPEQAGFTMFKVTHEYVARPDLICLAHYGTDDPVDIVCKINGISNPYELNEDTILALPDAADLWKYIYDGDTIQQDSESGNDDNPAPKTRIEKRKPNEAVIGDKRFKIDKEHRAVIY